MEMKLTRETGANDTSIGYNLTPRGTGDSIWRCLGSSSAPASQLPIAALSH